MSESATQLVADGKTGKREYVKRGIIKRGELSHLTPTEKSREYKRLAGRIERHCVVCNKGIDRSGYAKHLTTKKHLLAEENINLKKMLRDSARASSGELQDFASLGS